MINYANSACLGETRYVVFIYFVTVLVPAIKRMIGLPFM